MISLLGRLERFEMHCDGFGGVEFERDNDGQWVDIEDVNALITNAALIEQTWTTEPPSISGFYWHLCSDGSTGLIEISEYDMGYCNGETSESVADMTEALGITHWCGPLQHPPAPSP